MNDLRADESLLLQAVFADGEHAERAWRLWQERVPLDDIDAASQRALPQLHLNNANDTTVDSRIQGLYRRAWYSNNLLREQVKTLLDRLTTAGVRFLAARQSAAVVKAPGCYPLDRFHLLIGDRDLDTMLAALRETGWKKHGQLPPGYAEAALRGLTFEQGRFVVHVACEPADGGLWGRVERVEADSSVVEVPGLEDQLLEAAAPTQSWNRISMYQRLLETLLVMQYGNRRPDWPLLARIAAAARSTLPLADALEYLERDFGIGLPEGYLAGLRELATPHQAEEYRLRRDARSLWRRIRLGSFEYRELREQCAARGRSLSPLAYLKLRWDVRDVKGIMAHLTSRVADHARNSR